MCVLKSSTTPPKVCMLSHFSHVQLFVTLWTVARHALSLGFFRQEHWNGLSCPPPGDLPNPAIKPTSPVSPALQADSLSTEPPEKPIKSERLFTNLIIRQLFLAATKLDNFLSSGHNAGKSGRTQDPRQ